MTAFIGLDLSARPMVRRAGSLQLEGIAARARPPRVFWRIQPRFCRRNIRAAGGCAEKFSQHPPVETLVRQTSETILRLAEMGNVIIVGRGANIITARLPLVLHLRLIGSVEKRVAHVLRFDKLDRKEALQRIKREDGGRRRYLRKHFGKDIDDPLLYHLVINTNLLGLHEAALMVGKAGLKQGW